MVIENSTTVKLYSLNHSLFHQFPLLGNTGFPMFLTEDLFDNDSTNLEYLISTTAASGQRFVKIYREDGTLLEKAVGKNDLLMKSISHDKAGKPINP